MLLILRMILAHFVTGRRKSVLILPDIIVDALIKKLPISTFLLSKYVLYVGEMGPPRSKCLWPRISAARHLPPPQTVTPINH